MEDTKDIVAVHQSSPAAMMQMAIQGNADLDKLGKFLELQERWEATQARKAYVAAMAAFKANPPDIAKDRLVDFATTRGQTTYRHASLHNVATKINQALSAHGLSAAWKTGQENGKIAVTCTITHDMGHSESTTLSADPDNSGGKNSIQSIGSTVSYLERYTLLALTGLATRDMDDDGKESVQDLSISDEQAATIERLIKETGADEKKFCAHFGIEYLCELKDSQYKSAVNALNAKKAAKRQPGEEG